jgi:hypothetical protein
MLVPVAQHQTRFVVPGLTADPRGVAVGRIAASILPSLDRVVAALRALTEDVDLEELYRELEILRTRSSLGAVEFVLRFPAGDAHLLDRVSRVATLYGGELLTGDGRHLVRYRDRGSPLGYDVERLADGGRDLVLYGRVAEGSYRIEERIPLRQLIFRVAPEPARRTVPAAGAVLVLAPRGLRDDLEGYLWRSRIEADVARVDLSDRGGAGDRRPRGWTEGFLYRLADPPERCLDLLGRTPGLSVFMPAGERAAVQRGYVHPFALHACGPALEEGRYHLFEGGRSGALMIDGIPEYVPLRKAVAAATTGAVKLLSPRPLDARAQVPLTLVPDPTATGPASAVFVPPDQEESLCEILYRLPASILERHRVAVLDDGVLIVGSPHVEGLPLGRPLYRFGKHVLLPTGHAIRPRVGPDRVAEILGASESRIVLFEPGEKAPRVVDAERGARLEPLGGAFLARLAVSPFAPRTLPKDRDAVRVGFDGQGAFPLWGRRFDTAAASGGGEGER